MRDNIIYPIAGYGDGILDLRVEGSGGGMMMMMMLRLLLMMMLVVDGGGGGCHDDLVDR